MKNLTKSDKSLLLFFESACVENGGVFPGQRLSAEDYLLAINWSNDKFVRFGRISAHDIHQQTTPPHRTHWCTLSEEAWTMAAAARKERATRNIKSVRLERIGFLEELTNG